MYIDHTNPDSIEKAKRETTETLLRLRDGLHRCTAHECCGPLDVRLVANTDGETWFATGDVSYDTVHGTACGAIELTPDLDGVAITELAGRLVDEVVEALFTCEDK